MLKKLFLKGLLSFSILTFWFFSAIGAESWDGIYDFVFEVQPWLNFMSVPYDIDPSTNPNNSLTWSVSIMTLKWWQWVTWVDLFEPLQWYLIYSTESWSMLLNLKKAENQSLTFERSFASTWFHMLWVASNYVENSLQNNTDDNVLDWLWYDRVIDFSTPDALLNNDLENTFSQWRYRALLSSDKITDKTKTQIEADWDWIEFNLWESYVSYISDASSKYYWSKVDEEIEGIDNIIPIARFTQKNLWNLEIANWSWKVLTLDFEVTPNDISKLILDELKVSVVMKSLSWDFLNNYSEKISKVDLWKREWDVDILLKSNSWSLISTWWILTFDWLNLNIEKEETINLFLTFDSKWFLWDENMDLNFQIMQSDIILKDENSSQASFKWIFPINSWREIAINPELNLRYWDLWNRLCSKIEIAHSDSEIANYNKIYYVDNEDWDDNNDWLSKDSPWKSIWKVNAWSFQPGDHILFKAWGKWQGNLIVEDSWNIENPIVYWVYWEWNPPVISVIKNNKLNWEEESENIWKTSGIAWANLSNRISLDWLEILWTHIKDELWTLIPDQVRWYQDNDNLYIYSEVDPSDMIIWYNSPDKDANALTILANNIKLQDIEFEWWYQSSIKIFLNSSNVTLDNIKAGNFSKTAIMLLMTENVVIKNSVLDANFTFDYSQSDEYKLASDRGSYDWLILNRSNSGTIIRNNFFKNWWHWSAYIDADKNSWYEAANIKVYNNYFTSPDITYWWRFTVYWNSHDIEFFNNYIHDISTELYLGWYNNHFHNNIINKVRTSPIKSWAQIWDGIFASWYWNIYENNFIANTESECFRIWYDYYSDSNPYDNIIRNNIFYNCWTKMQWISIWVALEGYRTSYPPVWISFDSPSFKNNLFENNIMYSSEKNKPILHYYNYEPLWFATEYDFISQAISIEDFESNYTESLPARSNTIRNTDLRLDAELCR